MFKDVICLLTHKPHIEWLEFLSKFLNYDIYIVVDDNSQDYKEIYSNYNNINIIQINNETCKESGFVNMNFLVKKDITAWEKAMYYFSTIHTKYCNIWLIEDDNVFYSEETLLNIDLKYGNQDLLSNKCAINASGRKNYWWWSNVSIEFEPPYYSAMVCSIRASFALISEIKKYAHQHNTLFFLEALFPTICRKYNMKHESPPELETVIYKQKVESINKTNIFHPVKDVKLHKALRESLID